MHGADTPLQDRSPGHRELLDEMLHNEKSLAAIGCDCRRRDGHLTGTVSGTRGLSTPAG